MHQHVLPFELFPKFQVLCVKNCGCRYPSRSHCAGCHTASEQFKISQRSSHETKATSSPPSSSCCSQMQPSRELEYLFVIDFECTCDQARRLTIQEIIEFPIVVIDLKKNEIIDTFHSFVRPTIYPRLTPFCTRLTGITQQQVDVAPTLEQVLVSAELFLAKYITNGVESVAVLNDCDSDIRNFLFNETEFKKLRVKPVLKQFIDLRRIFPKAICQDPFNIDVMLESLELTFEGKKHSGIDDAKNIARVALKLAQLNYVYKEDLKENMVLLDNPHYFEHVIVISTAESTEGASISASTVPEEKTVEVSFIAHNLRRAKTQWDDSFRAKHLKRSDVKKELLQFVERLGIDVNNAVLAVQGKLSQEILQDTKQPCSEAISAKQFSSFLTNYVSLQAISKEIGVPLGQKNILMNHPPRNNLLERGGNHPSLTSINRSNNNSRYGHGNGHCFTSEPIPVSVAHKATFLCGFIEDILSSGFIFHKDVVTNDKPIKTLSRSRKSSESQQTTQSLNLQ